MESSISGNGVCEDLEFTFLDRYCKCDSTEKAKPNQTKIFFFLFIAYDAEEQAWQITAL